MPEGFINKSRERRMAGAPAFEEWAPAPDREGFEFKWNPLGYKEYRALSTPEWANRAMAYTEPEKVSYRSKEDSENPIVQRHEAIHIAQARGLTTPGEEKVRYRVGKYEDPYMSLLKEGAENGSQETYAMQMPAYEFEQSPIDDVQLYKLKAYLDELRWLNPDEKSARGLATFESAIDPTLMREYLKRRPLAPLRPDPKMQTAGLDQELVKALFGR
jgi:hypothetical protein